MAQVAILLLALGPAVAVAAVVMPLQLLAEARAHLSMERLWASGQVVVAAADALVMLLLQPETVGMAPAAAKASPPSSATRRDAWPP